MLIISGLDINFLWNLICWTSIGLRNPTGHVPLWWTCQLQLFSPVQSYRWNFYFFIHWFWNFLLSLYSLTTPLMSSPDNEHHIYISTLGLMQPKIYAAYDTTNVCQTNNTSWLLFYVSNTETEHIGGLMQERCNSIANTLELHLSCTNPSIWAMRWTDSRLNSLSA